jgi:hypothetical protein
MNTITKTPRVLPPANRPAGVGHAGALTEKTHERKPQKRSENGRARHTRPLRCWEPGQTPRGTRHKVTRPAEMLLEADAEAVTRKALELALAGDTVALRLCINRLVPPRRPGDRPVELTERGFPAPPSRR